MLFLIEHDYRTLPRPIDAIQPPLFLYVLKKNNKTFRKWFLFGTKFNIFTQKMYVMLTLSEIWKSMGLNLNVSITK